MASPHPFRTIKEGILKNRPANISDKNYAVLCEAVKDLDEDSYHVDLDEDMQGIAGDEPRPLTENPREMIAQALLKSGKPRNMSEERYESLQRAVMALPTSISEYDESYEMKRARTYGATAGHTAGGAIGSVYGFFGCNSYEAGAGVGEVVGVSAAVAVASRQRESDPIVNGIYSIADGATFGVLGTVHRGVDKLAYGWKAGGAGGGAIGATNGSGTIGTNVAYVAGGVIGTASVVVVAKAFLVGKIK